MLLFGGAWAKNSLCLVWGVNVTLLSKPTDTKAPNPAATLEFGGLTNDLLSVMPPSIETFWVGFIAWHESQVPECEVVEIVEGSFFWVIWYKLLSTVSKTLAQVKYPIGRPMITGTNNAMILLCVSE